MGGTLKGGLKAAETNKRNQGDDFYKRIGAMGGSVAGWRLKKPKGFAADRERASRAGRLGGMISRKSK